MYVVAMECRLAMSELRINEVLKEATRSLEMMTIQMKIREITLLPGLVNGIQKWWKLSNMLRQSHERCVSQKQLWISFMKKLSDFTLECMRRG
ncbi:unnamed protein product [Linum trigynum]|uniref:Uncharacterized protein n=1 Tax=Linum trigynum TaxID=586398 RepID=A0AAV2GQF8_9ROSI